MVQPSKNILIVGVGGQGVILASNIVTEVALMSGLDVKKNEAHGQSQRSGSVPCHIRYGKKIYSPIILPGEADLILAFEMFRGPFAYDTECVWLTYGPGQMLIVFSTLAAQGE